MNPRPTHSIGWLLKQMKADCRFKKKMNEWIVVVDLETFRVGRRLSPIDRFHSKSMWFFEEVLVKLLNKRNKRTIAGD